MVLVNEILDMRKAGMQDSEIVQKLKEKGFSPLEINKALEQSKIKEEIGKISGEQPTARMQDMQPSVMESQNVPESQQMPVYAPQPQQSKQEIQQTPQYIPQQPQQQAEIPEQYPQGGYDQYYPQEYDMANQSYGYQAYQPQSTETITEITEQIVEEKINDVRKKISEISAFKISTEKKIENLDERLKRIEEMIQELQIKILEKVSSYSQNLDIIKKEMEMMQDSFSKLVNPLIDLAREKKKKK